MSEKKDATFLLGSRYTTDMAKSIYKWFFMSSRGGQRPTWRSREFRMLSGLLRNEVPRNDLKMAMAVICVVVFSLFLLPPKAFGAGQVEDGDALSGMTSLLSSASCGPEAIIPVEVCELGQGLLCLNTPKLSVVDEQIVVYGTVDRRTSVFSHINAYVQHEYTKVLKKVRIEKIAKDDCWGDQWISSYDACIDDKGYIGIKVPLSKHGPYTIMVDAVSMDGETVSKTVRSSHVVAPELSIDNITLSPDPIQTVGKVEANKLTLAVDMLGGCSFCDFVGTSTGGLMITVNNLINTVDGGVKTIERKGNIALGGKFDICVPLVSGRNKLTITACNAAAPDGRCPTVSGIGFDVVSGDVDIDVISPEEGRLIYDAEAFKSVPLNFTLGNYAHKDGTCSDGDVVLYWNRENPVSLCPSADGHYKIDLSPEVGINVGTIDVASGDVKTTKSFAFGWGKIVNPYFLEDTGWVDSGLSLGVGQAYINDSIRPLLNSFLNSDRLKLLLNKFLDTTGPKNDSAYAAEAVAEAVEEEAKKIEIDKIKDEIPYCSSGGDGLSGLKIKLVGDPVLNIAEIERLEFDRSKIGFKLNLDGFEIHLSLFKDENGDGMPDDVVLPLMIAFRGAQLNGKLEILQSGDPLYLISSDNTNCDYQSASYCKDKPAVLIPKHIAGGATKGGAFVRCDDKGQQISKKLTNQCVGLNITNAQTAEMQAMVLEMINDLIYCQGSAYLTYLMRDGLSDMTFSQTILDDRTFWINGGVSPARGRVDIDKGGIKAKASVKFGSPAAVTNLDAAAAGSGAGILVDPHMSDVSFRDSSPDSVSLSISTDVVNQILYQLVFQKDGGGLLDWDIDQFFFMKNGFDFVKECDEFDALVSGDDAYPTLCQLRPRIGELLGAALQTSGYFTSKHPLRLKLKGSRKIAPQVKIYKADVPYELPPLEGDEEVRYEYKPAQVLELQIPDLEVAFYAFEIDEEAGKDLNGNPSVLLNENGEPVIHSMIKVSEEPVPIIRVKMTILLALEIWDLDTLESDPSKLVLKVRPVPELVKIVFQNIDGGNATMVPDSSLLSAFREKINYGVEMFGDPDDPLTLELSKSIDLTSDEQDDDLLSILGLEKLSFGREGLSLKFDNASGHISITLKPKFHQAF